MKKGPCAKQIVTCEIVNMDTGERVYGENYCLNAQEVCPRGDLPSGQGYHLCTTVCKQAGHAEEMALTAIPFHRRPLNRWVAYVYGHSYICSSCHSRLREAGVGRIIVMRDSLVIK